MIRATIQAGFGNQLFQYAMAYSLAKRNKQELQLDISFYKYFDAYCNILNKPDYVRRRCYLTDLNIECQNYYGNSFLYIIGILSEKLKNKKFSRIGLKKGAFIKENYETCREYTPELLGNLDNHLSVIKGFWQNDKYFNDVLDELRIQLAPAYTYNEQVKTIMTDIESRESVAIHIRRGDFVDLGWNQNDEYYLKAMNMVKEKCKKTCYYYIFSDDIEWVKNKFGTMKNVKIVDINSEHKDLDEFFLMKNCKHQIISESTFGWWAAYLNENPNKIIFIPQSANDEIFNLGWNKL